MTQTEPIRSPSPPPQLPHPETLAQERRDEQAPGTLVGSARLARGSNATAPIEEIRETFDSVEAPIEGMESNPGLVDSETGKEEGQPAQDGATKALVSTTESLVDPLAGTGSQLSREDSREKLTGAYAD